MFRAFRYRLYPTPAQAEALGRQLGLVRLVYNLALEQRSTFWRQYRRATGRPLGYVAQCRELTEFRAQVPWAAEGIRTAQEQALRDLDAAFASFFAGRTRYPTPRKRGVQDGFRLKGDEVSVRRLNGKWAFAVLPKIGPVRLRLSRPLPGEAVRVSFSEERGQWFASFGCELPDAAPLALAPAIGIDRGVANTLALSTGELLSLPPTLAALDKRARRAQRILSRRKKGSNRRRRQVRRVAAIRAKACRIRTDWHHRQTTDLARRFGVVALEKLQTANMTRRGRGKRGLNRSILAQGWGQFERLLAYKLAAAGGRLISVDPAYTSQTCAECGVVDRRSRESQARFQCTACGHGDHADVNAARNIIRRASSPLLDAEGSHLRPPVETSTLAA